MWVIHLVSSRRYRYPLFLKCTSEVLLLDLLKCVHLLLVHKVSRLNAYRASFFTLDRKISMVGRYVLVFCTLNIKRDRAKFQWSRRAKANRPSSTVHKVICEPYEGNVLPSSNITCKTYRYLRFSLHEVSFVKPRTVEASWGLAYSPYVCHQQRHFGLDCAELFYHI